MLLCLAIRSRQGGSLWSSVFFYDRIGISNDFSGACILRVVRGLYCYVVSSFVTRRLCDADNKVRPLAGVPVRHVDKTVPLARFFFCDVALAPLIVNCICDLLFLLAFL